MKAERKKKKIDRIRKEILHEALSLLEKEGVDAVTIRKIADLMDSSVGVIYNYFKNKDEILNEIYRETCRLFLEGLKKKELEDQKKERHKAFIGMCVYMCEFRIENSHRYREIFLKHTFEKAPEELLEIRKHIQKKLTELQLQTLNTENAVYEASRLLVALAEGIASLALRDKSEDIVKKSAQSMEHGVKAFLHFWSNSNNNQKEKRDETTK